MNYELIDLVEAGKKFKNRIGPVRFGWQIVELCNDVVVYGLKSDEKELTVRCIVSLLNSLRFWVSIGPIPVQRVRVDEHQSEKEKVELLARSIVETASRKRSYIFGSHPHSHWNKNEFSQGIEWACYSIRSGAPIESSDKVPRLEIKNA